jgi:hypothetical protein
LHNPVHERNDGRKADAAAPTAAILVAPARDHHGDKLPGKYDAYLGGEVIVRATATPFCTNFVILSRGRVLEGDGRPRFAAWKPFAGGLAPVKASTAQRANASTDHGHGRSHNDSRED